MVAGFAKVADSSEILVAGMSSSARFAVLVTGGTGRGFSGLDEESGVVIALPKPVYFRWPGCSAITCSKCFAPG
jgi:hypothetical protein